jgi:hypothetical protein
MDVDAALTFLDFVSERHRIWEQRQVGAPQPWTDDPVLATRKFTNVFRLLDPGSQFVITDLLCDDEFEFLARCLLYRITNLPEAWSSFDGDLSLVKRPGEFREHLHARKARGERVFSGAYMIWGGTEKGVDKIDHVFGVLEGASEGLADFLVADTQAERFEALARCRGMGYFNAMQILTDFGYSTEFREDDFVVPGPGALKGAAVLGMSGEEAIEWAHQEIDVYHDNPPMIWGSGNRGHFLSKMDVQNCLCEFSKYARFASKPSPEKPYSPAHPGVQSAPVLPPNWHTTI